MAAIHVSIQVMRESLSRAFVKFEPGLIKAPALLVLESSTRKRFAFSQSTHARKARLMRHASFLGFGRHRGLRYIHSSFCTQP